MNIKQKNPENQHKTVQLYRLGMNKQQALSFCSFLLAYGASFYTMRDKLVYGCRMFSLWELKGVQGMISGFAPDYKGRPQDFFERLEGKERFVQYMVESGQMGRTTCYARFKRFNFRPWEILGLEPLYDKFLSSRHFVEI